MTKQVQRRRGTNAQHSSFTGAEGELSVNTTNKSVHVHDGSTAGGIELARKDGSNVAFTSGTLDGVTIGGTTAGAGTFTNLTATGNAAVSGDIDLNGTKILLPNKEKANLSADGHLSFDSSQGLILYRTQQGVSGDAVTVLDGANVAAGTGVSITNLGAGGTGTETFTFSIGQAVGTGDSPTFAGLSTTGDVGIGTSSPSTRLHTDVTGGDNELRIATTTSGDPTLALYANGAGAHAIAFDRNDLALTFTAVGSSERARIDASGNVGIGTTNPSAKLDVAGDAEINGLTVGRGAGDLSSNTAVGNGALNANTTGSNNVVNGYQALYSNTTGGSNVANGYRALFSNTTGSRNTALGATALFNTESAGNGNNTAVGFQAGYYNATGINNTALGADALIFNTTASNNAAVGYSALYANTTGTNNVAMGVSALNSNTTGSANTALGRSALVFNTTASSNTAVGYNALYSNTTGDNNTANGYQAFYSNTTGTQNVATGYRALFSNTTANYNTATGYRALFANTTGSDNVAMGYQAGDVITTGARNIIFGRLADPSAASGNDQVVIGDSLTGKGDETAFIGGTNGAYNEKNVTTWETTSDQRIKKNIVDNDDGLSVLSQIQVRNFEYRTPDEITDLPSHAAVKQDGTQIGVIAQEIQQVLPECVSENSTGVLSVNTDPLVWYLINAVKELKTEIEQLKGN